MALKVTQALKVRVATRSGKWWCSTTGILALGTYVECYARSLAGLIMLECPSLGPRAPGHCAHPFWLAICGLLMIGVGGLGLCWLMLRAIVRKWSHG